MFNNTKSSIKSSLRNLYPKIGIRPTIDARMGIRESLENQTMNMAKSVINLLSSNLKYPNGKSVDCIISDNYFRGGGFSTDYLSEGGMPVTMSRINLVKGVGPVLQIAEGFTVTLNDKMHNIIDNRTDSTWPTTWFTPVLTGKGVFTDAYSVMNNWGANHASICYGHIGADLITLASMLRIPVCLHNVEKERIFRPSAWNAFGTLDIEGADFRACKNFGPIYGVKQLIFIITEKSELLHLKSK